MQSWFRANAGLTVLQALITLGLIGILTGTLILKFQRVTKETQDVAVRVELQNIRRSIALYKVLNQRTPQSLQELMEKELMLPARIGTEPGESSFYKQKYLLAHALDAQGNILDPFENPYVYDPASGTVRATTKGYESW
jgi:type II secretory pathway pseudopilin PulG